MLASRQPSNSVKMSVAEPKQGLIAKSEPGTIRPASGKPQSIESHTQAVQSTTQTLQSNTRALKDNTQALQANTQALEANVRAAQLNARLRGEQIQQTAQPVTPSVAPVKTHVRSSNALVKAPVRKEEEEPANPMPADLPARKQIVPAAVAKAPVKEPKLELPAKVAPKPAAPKPQPAVSIARAHAKNEYAMPKEVKTTEKQQLHLAASASASTMKPFNTPVKIETRKTIASEMPKVDAAPKAAEEPKVVVAPKVVSEPAPIVPASKAPAMSAVKPSENVAAKNLKLRELLQLPVLGKSFDGHAHKTIAYAGKTGLKEGDIITTQGCLRVVSTEDSATDHETYYLQLTLSAQSGDSCFIVKISSGELASLTAKQTADNAKKFIRESLIKGRVPCQGGNMMRKPVYVSITGELAYNGSHAAGMRGNKLSYMAKRNMHSYTPWEISNISRIEFILP